MKISYLADHKELIPTLAGWFFKEWSYLYPERTRDDFLRLIGERTNKTRLPLTLVALDSESVIGTISLKMHDMNTRQNLTPWLASLYVSENLRGKGLGAKLVDALEKKAQELKIEKLYLYTPGQENFYSNLGWQVKERTKYRGHPVAIMEKNIVL